MEQNTKESELTLILPPMLCAPVEVYACVRAFGASANDYGRRFDKRFKLSHRFAIADTRGRLELTVPIAKPETSSCRWEDIRISGHGEWWDVHRVALESAYGRTPFFEFYIDRLLPMLTDGVTERFASLADLINAWDSWIRRVLLLPPAVQGNSSTVTDDNGTVRLEEATLADTKSLTLPSYWQVRADKLGFIAGLSVLDLIFNLGPEAVIYIDKAAQAIASGAIKVKG